MSDLIVASQSPFDSIRREDADGEYWLARELMPLLGYARWNEFKSVIENAKENIETIGLKLSDHFSGVELKSSGRTALDYRMSRLAAYHVALCCDSRGKESVKFAKHYFAIKTREAEVKIPALDTELEKLRYQNENLKLQLAWADKQDSRIALHGLEVALFLEGKADVIVEVEKPIIEVIDDRHNTRFTGQTLAQINEYLKTRYGIRKFKSGADLKRYLERTGKGDLIAQTLRSISSDYVPEENLDALYDAVLKGDRQVLLGENEWHLLPKKLAT